MLSFRAILLILCAGCAWSGIVYNFESPTYVVGPLSGHDGWLVNPGGYSDGTVYSYSSTGAPLAPNPGAQFLVVQNQSEIYHIEPFAGSSRWTVTFDIFVHSFSSGSCSGGPGSPCQSAGSFYMFTSGTGYQFHAFPAVNSTGWNAKFDVWGPTGVAINSVDLGSGFDGLQMDHWYQEQIVFNTALNQILSVSISDPNNSAANATYHPTGWYFRGGASGPFNVNGIGTYGIGTLAFDNISLDPAPEPATWALCLIGAAALCGLRGRRRA